MMSYHRPCDVPPSPSPQPAGSRSSRCPHATGFATDPRTRVVAEVGGHKVTAGAGCRHTSTPINSRIPPPSPRLPATSRGSRAASSTTSLNGEILLQEAQRRGITVSDEELAEYLAKDVPTARPTRAPRCGAI